MKILCIIPARAGSKRIKNKNFINFFGQPIIKYSIDSAIKSKVFSKILVSTDIIKTKFSFKNSDVTFHQRSSKYSGDNASLEQTCLKIINDEEKNHETYDYFCCLTATSPLRDEKDIRNCNKIIKKHKPNFLMATTDFYYDPMEALEKKKNHVIPLFKNEINIRKKKSLCVDNGSIYFCRVDKFKKYQTFYGPNLINYHMPRIKSIDVNNNEDLEILKIFFKEMRKKK